MLHFLLILLKIKQQSPSLDTSKFSMNVLDGVNPRLFTCFRMLATVFQTQSIINKLKRKGC